jgi:phage terminase large subunit-like protein
MKRPIWTTACPDWEERIVNKRSLITFDPLFPDQAQAALDIFTSLRVADVAGQPNMGQICRPWTLDFVSSIFGSYDADAGRRLITEYLLLISKKNSKSTSAAGIMLTALLMNWRESAEFLILAPTVEIANNSFYPARDMVRNDPELSVLLQVQDHVRTITHRVTKATLKVIAAENDTVGGKKASGVLIDELWLFGKRLDAENMLREATGGLASRPEGFVIYLTTQSDSPPAGVFEQKLKYARDVRDGKVVDPQFLPVLYEFPEAMLKAKQERLVENFYLTNPNLGASVDNLFLERELRKATNDGEGSLRGFLAKHLNVQIGMALRGDRWAGADFWEAAADTSIAELDEVIRRSDVITVGLDGGGLDDLLGFCVLGRDATTGQWLHWAKALAHPIVLERQQAEAARLTDFANQGDLTLVERIGQDVEEVVETIGMLESTGKLDKIGVDPVGIGAIVEGLEAIGIPLERIVGISQGWKLNGAIKTTERKVAAREMVHGGRPLMAWCVSNAKVEPRGNAITVTKQASGTAKIDPLAATFNAVALMSLAPVSLAIGLGYELLSV